MPFRPPLDARNQECAKLVLQPGAARDRLTSMVYVSKANDPTGVLEQAFVATVACEPIDKKLREAVKSKLLTAGHGVDLPSLAKEKGVISAEELALWQRKETLRKNVIKVDHFPQDFGRAEILEKLADESLAKVKAA